LTGYKPNKLGAIYPSCEYTEFTSLFAPYGNKYHIESHYTYTTDGYGLLIFRVRLDSADQSKLPADKQNNINQPVLLTHGLTDSSDGWFLNGDKGSVGFYMVNQGYDVWVANNRGNKYSRTNKNSTMNDQTFFDYSYTE